jgi:hypothetical protein
MVCLFGTRMYFGIFTGPCCIQVVKSGLLVLLLRIFERWDRYEGKIHLKICSCILMTLQHLCSTSEFNYCIIKCICELIIMTVLFKVM